MKIPLHPNEVDWGHFVLALLLVIAVISRFRTSHHRRFTVSFTMKREKDDQTETEDKDDGSMTDREGQS